ncbi:MAG: arginase family protein, partial [Desulfurococcaceae archaeon]
VAPGVSNPEPLGLSLEEFAKALIKVLSKTENLVAVDLVEVNPLVDHGDITSIVAAKIGLEIVGLYVEKMKSS